MTITNPNCKMKIWRANVLLMVWVFYCVGCLLLAMTDAQRLHVGFTSSSAPILNRSTNGSRSFGSFCPQISLQSPCKCIKRTQWLTLSCERASLSAIKLVIQHFVNTSVTIKYLKLRYCDIPVLPPKFFEGLAITHLIITQSNLATINESAFNGLENSLESLDLSHNSLGSVPSATLRNLRQLISLNMGFNKIETLENDALDGLDNLLILYMYDNRIQNLQPRSLRGAKILNRLNLGKNLFFTVPIQALQTLSQLETLELHENQIQNISESMFRNLTKLDTIILSENQITRLPARVFGNDTLLNSIDLENNVINVIDRQAFVGVEHKLEWLKLGKNHLDRLPVNALRRLRLKQLDLRENEISAIPDDAFEEYGKNLKYIDLRKNKIQTIPSTALYNLHLLQWLQLSNNKLTTIPQETYEPVLDTLKILDIHDNPLTCDCRMHWFREWSVNEGFKVVRFPELVQCFEPSNLRYRLVSDVLLQSMSCPMTTQEEHTGRIFVN